ncbi:HIT family protein [Leucobacter chromiiresistens]|uniref:HIT family hydrolase n=1 Tax=Leucobacter chromiiresistens TaxID=1079994 RepID=A0A147EMS8_9MICO|nr:HIT domain-containing protein [Leucobacter chromiiresistens]KTR85795.1 HIT family hydrolase [Leucobacter chromiiresistens]
MGGVAEGDGSASSASAGSGVSPADERAESLDESGAVGVADDLRRLWVPHRMVYVSDHQQPAQHDCPFCAAPERSDSDALIVARGEHAYVLLNLFPYNSGHLLVCPYRHISTYDEASAAETAEIAALTQTAMRVARATLACDGFNIGMNQGEIAGAGIAAHLHQHVVPRWASDANFFPIIAKTKAMPQLLGEVRDLFADAWPRP